MSGVLTSSELIRSIKRRAMIPSDQNTFTDEDFLEMLNEELQYFGIPHLLRTHEEYLLTFEDIPLSNGDGKYPIPYRAIGNKLREASYITNVSGLTSNPGSEQVYELARISVEDLPDYNNYASSRYAQAFYLENNNLVLLGEVPITDAVLRMHFYLRPNTLVLDSKAGKIQSIDAATGTVVLESFPTEFSSSPDMDFVQDKSPNIILGYDKTPTSVDSATRTVIFNADDIPGDLVVGDYLNIAQETIVPQLPVELHAILAQRVAVAALEALGDQEGLVAAQKRLEMMEKASNDIIDNRVEGAPEKINNRHGTLREAVINRRGFGRGGVN
jgi:hypothetical protein